jgi:putative transposase
MDRRARENCYIEPQPIGERLHQKLQYSSPRDQLLNGEIFYSVREASIITGSWRRHYDAVGPHASLAYKIPAPEMFAPRPA